jgi:hypothetical protein
MFCLNGQTFSSLTGRTSGLPYDQFLNLILNAAQAMKFCGEPTIRITESSRNVSISFIDNGCGMEKAVQERLYGPFFTTKAALKTEAGLGSTFTVLLPRKPSTRLVQIARAADPRHSTVQRFRCLALSQNVHQIMPPGLQLCGWSIPIAGPGSRGRCSAGLPAPPDRAPDLFRGL